MRLSSLLAALLLSACTVIVVNDETRAAWDREVTEATARWADAFNSRDPDRIAAQYDADAVLLGTTSVTLRATPATIHDYFKNAGKRPDARVRIDEQHVRVAGDMASNTGLYTFTDVRDGKPVSNPSRFTLVFVKRDGKWIIVSHHSSRVPAPS